MMKTLVLCLGNVIARNDAAGFIVARELRRLLSASGKAKHRHGAKSRDVDIVECSYSGAMLLSKISGYDRVIIVDSTHTLEKGKVGRINIEDIKPRFATSAHDLALMDVLSLIEKLAPEEKPKEIEVYGVGIGDAPIHTFGDEVDEDVRKGAKKLAHQVARSLRRVDN